MNVLARFLRILQEILLWSLSRARRQNHVFPMLFYPNWFDTCKFTWLWSNAISLNPWSQRSFKGRDLRSGRSRLSCFSRFNIPREKVTKNLAPRIIFWLVRSSLNHTESKFVRNYHQIKQLWRKVTLTSWHWIRSYFSSVWVGIIRYPMKGHSETFSKRYNIFIIRCLWWVRGKVFTANWWCKFLFRMPIIKYYPSCAQLNLKWTGARHILCIGENVWFAGLWVTKGDANRDAVSHQSSATEHVTLHEIQTFNVRSWCRY